MHPRSYYFFISDHRQSLKEIMLARMRPHNPVTGKTPVLLDGSLQGPYNNEEIAYDALRITDIKQESYINNPASISELDSARVKFFVVEVRRPTNKARVIDNVEKIHFLNLNAKQDYDRMAEQDRTYQSLMLAYNQAIFDHNQDPSDNTHLDLAMSFKQLTQDMEEDMHRNTRYKTTFTQLQLRKAFVPQELKHRAPKRIAQSTLCTPGFSSFMHAREDARKEMETVLKMEANAHENENENKKPRRTPSLRRLK